MTVTLCLVLLMLGSTPSRLSEGPLGRVWLSLPHLVSNSLEVCWQLLWDPNSTELNNNSTPTRSPTGSLNRMFNCHQAEIEYSVFFRVSSSSSSSIQADNIDSLDSLSLFVPISHHFWQVL